ncbi:F-box and wd40 domain protein, partial [Reticulomyxa filosa]
SITFILNTFRSSCKLLQSLIGHTSNVWNIDYLTFNNDQLLCSGSSDKTIRVWNIKDNKQIQSFNGHTSHVYCAKFSPYHYYNNHRNVICSSSYDTTIRFWDIKNNKQFEILNENISSVGGIELSSFNCGKYLVSGLWNKTIRLWDIETYKLLHIFDGHASRIWCIDISPLQSNSNKNNNICVIGGNGYTICSGSYDKTIRVWDIETAKQLIVFKGHGLIINSVKYGSNELGVNCGANTILSGSEDYSVRLWDIRSGQQIQSFNGHNDRVNAVEYSPFVVKNKKICINSNVICSGSSDKTIRFWDIRSNKKEICMIHENDEIYSIKFLQLKNNNSYYSVNMCYGLNNGSIHICG